MFHLDDAVVGQTVASTLRVVMKISWGEAKRLLQTRRVQIHGNLVIDAARRVAAGDVLRILPHSQAPPPKSTDVRIRYIDAHLVVVEKPSGMTTVRHAEERNWSMRRRQLQPTLEESLNRIVAKRTKQSASRERQSPRVRPVHRLDRDTSGLMIFARTVPAERGLVQQFSGHSIDRKYLAIVVGHVLAMTIESKLVRDRGDGRRGSAKEGEDGKRAVTHVKPIEWLDGYTLLECRLETGRTHQIRIHLSEQGHPVIGDKVYRGSNPRRPIEDNSGAPRLGLHACELGFIHPITQKQLHFEMPLPKELDKLVRRLRKHPD